MGQRADVGQRITLDRDDAGVIAGCDGAEFSRTDVIVRTFA
jgi:hypothetical protein